MQSMSTWHKVASVVVEPTSAYAQVLGSFGGRQRRFGRTGEQVEVVSGA